MALRLGVVVPDFEAITTKGPIKWHEFVGNAWAILFSHPKSFTPICTTELGEVAKLKKEWEKRGVKVAALSCDTVEANKQWAKDIEAYNGGHEVFYPIICDQDRKIATMYGMLDPNSKGDDGMPITVRALFYIGPDKKHKANIFYPADTGRSFDEVLRELDALQLAAKYPVATPVNWRPGDEVVISPKLSDEEAKQKFPKGFRKCSLPSGKNYLRFTPDPER